MKFYHQIIFLLITFIGMQSLGFSQELYNNCGNALMLCPNKNFSITNIDATKTGFPNGEDDFTFCYANNNTIWLKFETNAVGGAATVSFSNVIIAAVAGRGTQLQAVIIDAAAPCDGTTYSLVSNCVDNAVSNFTLQATALLPNKMYYISINGAINGAATLPAEASMDVTISGVGVDRAVPFVAMASNSANVCENTPVVLTAYRQDCPDSTIFRWYKNDTLIALSWESFFITSGIKNGDVITVKTDCFTYCITEIEASMGPISVFSFPLDAGPTLTIDLGNSIQLQATSTADSVSWAPSTSLSDPTLLQPLASPSETTQYFLTGYKNGCAKTDETTVIVRDDLKITNTFSPNEDGINDTWEIPSLENYPNCLVQIFTRWGQLVYQSSGYSAKKAWNGTSKGKEVEAGVYFFVIDVRDAEFPEPIKGALNLIR